MTTTLRPTRPVRTEDDGTRSATYAVCVNSRPVGAIAIGTDRRYGPTVGRINALTIDEPDRHRGRGTVAALAAEEVLRQWGCTRVETTAGAGMPYALRMTASLGYTERNRGMLLALPEPPPGGHHALPPGTALRPMREDEYGGWRGDERDGYIAALTASGVPREQAATEEAAGFDRAFPDGLATPAARSSSSNWTAPPPATSPGYGWPTRRGWPPSRSPGSTAAAATAAPSCTWRRTSPATPAPPRSG